MKKGTYVARDSVAYYRICKAAKIARKAHSLKSKSKDNVKKRFWSKVEIKGPDECWLWKASKSKQGYGEVGVNGRHTKAHRFAYIIEHGEIDRNIFVCHACDNPPCCNPKHLFLGTNIENIRDSINKGRFNKNRKRGESHPCRKLNNKIVKYIRDKYEKGIVSCQMISNETGIPRGTIEHVVTRRTWKHI